MRPDHLLFFFSALGVFNGLLLTVWLLLGAKRTAGRHYWLSGLVLMVVIRIGVSCFYYFQGRIPWSVVQVGLMAQMMIGPFLLVYLLKLLNTEPPWQRLAIQVLTGQLFLLALIGTLYSFAEHPAVWDYYFRYGIHACLSGYLVIAGVVLYRELFAAKGKEGLNWNRMAFDHRLGVIVYGTILAISLGFVISLYVNYVLGPIIASGVFYTALAITYLESRRKTKAGKPSLPAAESQAIRARVEAALLNNRHFAQPDLKLKDVAGMLELTPAQLSRFLNQELGQNFTQYLAGFRLVEARRLLIERPELTVEAVGYEAGFSSRSTFFAVFKEQLGTTPGAFQKKHTHK